MIDTTLLVAEMNRLRNVAFLTSAEHDAAEALESETRIRNNRAFQALEAFKKFVLEIAVDHPDRQFLLDACDPRRVVKREAQKTGEEIPF